VINSFTFNGVSSETIGLYVGGQKTFGAPQRDVTKVSIPGRNGDLVRDNGRFLNTEIAYNVVAMDDFTETAMSVRNWLMSVKGYARLEDTYHPDHFRIARVTGTIDFETSAYNKTGKAQVVFDCRPQRFLKSGETAVILSAEGTVTNPTLFDAKPLIRVRGSGDCSVTIGNQIIAIEDVDGYVDIDCETMNCYNGTVNCNSKVTLGAQGFPVLPPGNTGIDFAGGTTSVEITPRWWEI
jgi:phage-related protein